jgi:hypothetical protein
MTESEAIRAGNRGEKEASKEKKEKKDHSSPEGQ